MAINRRCCAPYKPGFAVVVFASVLQLINWVLAILNIRWQATLFDCLIIPALLVSVDGQHAKKVFEHEVRRFIPKVLPSPQDWQSWRIGSVSLLTKKQDDMIAEMLLSIGNAFGVL